MVRRCTQASTQAPQSVRSTTLGIARRDLKPNNLLLTVCGHLKVADFGLATSALAGASAVCGTPGYHAPEMLRGEAYDARGADWWALGVTVLELMSCRACVSLPENNCSVRLLVQFLGWEVSKIWCGGSGLVVPEVPVRWLKDRFGEFPLAGFGRVLFSKIARADCNHKGALNCSA